MEYIDAGRVLAYLVAAALAGVSAFGWYKGIAGWGWWLLVAVLLVPVS